MVADIGKQLESGDLLGKQSGQSIAESGKSIQEKSQEFLVQTQQLARLCSTEKFSECVEAHIQVNNKHIEAVKEFQKRLKSYLPPKD